jgi:hypothetical protein
MMDALAKLEMAMRPQSVPSWLSSDSNHAPKVTVLGPRRSSVEYSDPTAGSIKAPVSGAPTPSASTGPTTQHATTGPSLSSVRPRAPIGLHKDPQDAREFASKESVYAAPRRARQRGRQQPSDQKNR